VIEKCVVEVAKILSKLSRTFYGYRPQIAALQEHAFLKEWAEKPLCC